jgi:uncharacterized protein YacL (UPF0231 family)
MNWTMVIPEKDIKVMDIIETENKIKSIVHDDLTDLEVEFRIFIRDEDVFIDKETRVYKVHQLMLESLRILDTGSSLYSNSIEHAMNIMSQINGADVLNWVQEKLFALFDKTFEYNKKVYDIEYVSCRVVNDWLMVVGNYKREKPKLTLINCENIKGNNYDKQD